ncbi:cytochrome c [Advenella sp. WQ 585]|uniref:Cytochrome c n=1 Tax=Advenella mandrilli TaxID=2800330 RepID=A0ABS1EFN7_9BURK|nr:cytochrome c [Advenella mandrilli]MBK1781062.1 cytochrome c [Advenella mandrilli]
MKKQITVLALACTTLFSAAANAQFAKPEDAVKYRQSAKVLMASHFGRMVPVIKGEAPYDAEAIKENVALLNTLAALPWGAFGPGFEGGDSKSEVWTDTKGFDEKRENFKVAIQNLSTAADSADLAQLKAAFGKAGQSCKSCHDSYRKD